ncbi:MAG: carbohydrate-binding family 9-like protein [Bryobacteraceae bacterium]|jgi:hypothetical protein
MILAVLFLTLMQTPQSPPAPDLATQADDPANVIESFPAQKDWEPNADPQSAEWSGVLGIKATRDYMGQAVALPPTEVRSRWTHKNLYLLFVCPYDELYLNPNPATTQETNKLWDWDVAEAFIGSDYLQISRYKEFQVSPQGEYVDLDIDQDDPKSPREAVEWQSGFTVRGRIEAQKKIWVGEMRIPFASLDLKAPKAGDELRIGLFRIAGPEPRRVYIAWRPTGAKTFHVPGAFGSLVLK